MLTETEIIIITLPVCLVIQKTTTSHCCSVCLLMIYYYFSMRTSGIRHYPWSSISSPTHSCSSVDTLYMPMLPSSLACSLHLSTGHVTYHP